MKIVDILANTKVGSVITDKRVLSVLKRKGLIYDYSYWGYLENPKLWYKEDGYSDWVLRYIFPKGNAPKVDSTHFKSREEIWETYGNDDIVYKGYKFATKYLDGCFNAYLYLCEKDGEKSECRARIAMPNGVI